MLGLGEGQAFISIIFMRRLTFSFDIGYASIGWCVIETSDGQNPRVIGTGVVIFPEDDCLASKRRDYRRMRRTIRARRLRIERVGKILRHGGVISEEEYREAGHPLPFVLAARALQKRTALTPLELWHVLRWYAHNRGYDGNCLWSNEQEEEEDAKREEAAKRLMENLGTTTMAETLCSYLKLDTKEVSPHLDEKSPKYKALQMAFPRAIVESEVRRICENATCLPEEVRRLVLDDADSQRPALAAAGVVLPRRYSGSALFGQLVPRLDNRIIERCPITWANVFEQRVGEQSGGDLEQRTQAARKAADKFAKAPKADCREFYEYRFARILANVRVLDAPLSVEQRRELWRLAREKGKFTKKEFIRSVQELTGDAPNNLENYFLIVPESERSLIFRPMDRKDAASGRAPYARPVLRQVVEEVLRGEDPTRPAASEAHPLGEKKAEDGVLYCLQDPESSVNKFLAQRSIDAQTNNPLVRHRLLIFGRLLRDMVNKYANGDASEVERCVVEVAREVRTFAGKSNKEIKEELQKNRKGFDDAVKFLKEKAPHLPMGANLIRKCRIAMDMDWTCPYTGEKYDVTDLPKMELEHIVPYSARETNALSALVLTRPEVNRMKGNRTGIEFIRECGGNSVPGRANLSVMTEAPYQKFVNGLNPKSLKKNKSRRKKMSDDDKCRWLRKKMLLVERKPGKTEKGVTPGMLTQSSQLMRMGAQVAKGRLPKATIDMIPGRITAETRKCWKLMGLLGAVLPETRGKNKKDVRTITHLHHAVDACSLGLIPHFIPAGTNGTVWAAMLKRRLTPEQAQSLRAVSKLFMFGQKDAAGMCSMRIGDIPEKVKDSIVSALQEKRVVQHIPADMSGAKLERNYKGLRIEKGKVCLKSKSESKTVQISALAGVDSERRQKIDAVLEEGKKHGGAIERGRRIAGVSVLKVGDNYGVAIIGEKTECIRHISVYKTLQRLKKENPGQEIRLLRKGMLVKVTHYKNAEKNGVWRVVSLKDTSRDGLVAVLIRPEMVGDGKCEFRLSSLLSAGLQILPVSYAGI